MEHAYTRKRGLERTVIQRRAKKDKKGAKKKKEERKPKQKTFCMRAGRRPSPEGTRLLFAGTISPMMCLGDGPTERGHYKTRRKARKKKKNEKRATTQSSKNQTSFFYVQLVGQGRHTSSEIRQRERVKNNNNNHKDKNKRYEKQNKLEHRVTQPMQGCRVRGYRGLGREQGNTANNRDWDYVCGSHFSPPDNAP